MLLFAGGGVGPRPIFGNVTEFSPGPPPSSPPPDQPEHDR